MARSIFSDVVLTDAHVMALENRALRENYFRSSDYWLNQFCSPNRAPPSLCEEIVGDLICLYDQVWLEGKRFDLDRLNQFSDDEPVQLRPELVRNAIWRIETGDTRGLSANRDVFQGWQSSDLEAAVSNAFWEARYLLERDFFLILADAESSFSQLIPLRPFEVQSPVQTSHQVASAFLRRNRTLLLDAIQTWFSDGHFNHFLDAESMKALGAPKQFLLEFGYISKCRRFEHYFLYLQEWFKTHSENALFGRIAGIEQAYRTSPDQPLLGDFDANSASMVIRIRLSDIVDYFPLPRTLEEAFEFRGSPHLQNFRHALHRWIDAFMDEPAFEAKARRELELASKDLKLLKRIRSLKSNPIVFGLKTGLSAIPVLSMASTAIDVVDYFFEHNVERRHGWILHPEHRHPIRS